MKIQTKISLWITGAGVLVSLIFSLIVFYEMSEQIYRQLDNELKVTVRNVMIMVLDREVEGEPQTALNTDFFLDSRRYWVKVWRNGTPVYTSKLARIIDLPVDFRHKKATLGVIIPEETINLHQDDKNEVTFRFRRIILKKSVDQPEYRIQVAIPVEKLNEEIKEVALIIIFGLSLSCLLFLGISRFLARRILKPIRRITNLAQEINSKDLTRRIPLNSTRDELYELSFALNQMLDRLQHSFTRQKEFIANAAHELNTPIANLRLFAEQALHDQTLPEPFLSKLGRQHKILLRLGRLLRNLMVLSTLELKQTIQPETFDFKALLSSVIADFAILFEINNIPLTIKAPESLTIYGDKEQLRRIVVNLLENAVKYNSDAAEIVVELTEVNHSLTLEISNGSPPIPGKELKQLFNQFFRVEKSRSREFGGCGLGLTIVREIVNLHGGNIQIKNEVQNRVKVVVELPIRPELFFNKS